MKLTVFCLMLAVTGSEAMLSEGSRISRYPQSAGDLATFFYTTSVALLGLLAFIVVGMGLYSLLEAGLLLVNAMAVLNKERFLSRMGWTSEQQIHGFGEQPGAKSQLINLIAAAAAAAEEEENESILSGDLLLHSQPLSETHIYDQTSYPAASSTPARKFR